MLTYRYFAAKAFEKTTGDMSEPMGESFSSMSQIGQRTNDQSCHKSLRRVKQRKRTIYSRSDRELR